MQTFRLVSRGEGGLACDHNGVALGALELVRAEADSHNRKRVETIPQPALAVALTLAYGPQNDNAVCRIHRALTRAAAALRDGDLCMAGIESVLIGLPDPTPRALDKLAAVATLEKWGEGWQSQPRVPAGQTGGGQWTSEGERGAAAAGGDDPALPISDGVYRPGDDQAGLITTGGAEEEETPRRSNGPPDDYTRLDDVFPGLREAPALAIPLAPIDGFLGLSATSDEANLEAAQAQYRMLMADINRIDPTFVDRVLLPPEGIAGLSWQARTNLINDLRMQRAVAYSKKLGDAGPLQVETLRFLQDAVDTAYLNAVAFADAGRLQPRLSRQEAIGNRVDFQVREDLMNLYNGYGIEFGAGTDVTINNRDYETSEGANRYRVPDARIGDIAFDWTLSPKTISSPQIRGFFRADTRPRAVVVVRPRSLGQDSTYLIPRPNVDLLRGEL